MSSVNEERLLQQLKSGGVQTAATLAAACAITPMGAHKLLARLAEQGLVQAREEVREEAAGPGRPARWWGLTEAGHARFADRHADLALQLIAQTRSVLGEAALEQLIAAREQEMAQRYTAAMSRCRGTAARLRELARLRAEEGYLARLERQGRDWLLIEDHCPICAAARSCQGFCRSELQLFRQVLGPGLSVQRVEHVLAEPVPARRCAYRIRAMAPDADVNQETM